LGAPAGIAVSGSNLFVANNANDGTIGEYTTAGDVVNASLIIGLSNPYAVAVCGSNLFVANNGTRTIGVYTTSGVVVNLSLISRLGRVFGIAVGAGSRRTTANAPTDR
jgi:uncharacterized membrane protein YfcA